MAGEHFDSDVENQKVEDVRKCGGCAGGLSENLPVESAEKVIEVVVLVPETEADPQLSRNSNCDQQCRVCQEEKEEVLINLGCQCRGGLAKAHESCIIKWFSMRRSNKCEICQLVAVNVVPPDSQTSYWAQRADPGFRGTNVAQEHQRGCYSPLWVAFSILVGGLLLDVLISITLGVSALPINIIIGLIVLMGLGTAVRLALEFCQEQNVRRVVQSVEANVNLRYHPAL